MNETSTGAAPGDAERARVQALNATQWLARLAGSYGMQGADELRLLWNSATGRIMTPEIAPGVAVGLSLSTLVFQFDEAGKPSPHPLDVDGKSSTEVEAWLLVELLHRGIDRDRFSKSLPYEPAHPMSGDEPKYAPQGLAGELKKLAGSYEDAAEILVRVGDLLRRDRDTITIDERAAADLMCWPERLEIGLVVRDATDERIRIAFTGADVADTRRHFVVHRGEARSFVVPLEQFASDNISPGEIARDLVEKIGRMRATAGG